MGVSHCTWKINYEKSVTQHEIANLRDITGYVKLRKVELTVLRRVNKDT